MFSDSMKLDKVTNLSFFLALGIVWQHSRLPWIPESTWHPSFLIALQVTNKMMEVIVPCFFFISGYLFYRTYTPKDYIRKLLTRIHSLLIPYLIWNTLFAFLWYVVIRCCPQYVSDRFPYDSVWDVLLGIFSCQYTILWYVGVIFVYALLAPFVWQMVYHRITFLFLMPLLCVVCVVFRHPFCSPILWLPLYSAGAYVGVHFKDFFCRKQPTWLTWGSLLLYPFIFYWDYSFPSSFSMNAVQWIGPTLCIGLYDFVNRLHTFVSHKAYKYSFFIYALHYLPVHVVQRALLLHSYSSWIPYMAYFLVPLATVLLIIVASKWTDKHAHSLYCWLSGGR